MLLGDTGYSPGLSRWPRAPRSWSVKRSTSWRSARRSTGWWRAGCSPTTRRAYRRHIVAHAYSARRRRPHGGRGRHAHPRAHAPGPRRLDPLPDEMIWRRTEDVRVGTSSSDAIGSCCTAHSADGPGGYPAGGFQGWRSRPVAAPRSSTIPRPPCSTGRATRGESRFQGRGWLETSRSSPEAVMSSLVRGLTARRALKIASSLAHVAAGQRTASRAGQFSGPARPTAARSRRRVGEQQRHAAGAPGPVRGEAAPDRR